MTSLLIVTLLSISSMLAATLKDFRKILLCVWLAHLMLGCLALQAGAFFFAFSIWMLGTILAGVFFVFSLVFGEAITLDRTSGLEPQPTRSGEELLGSVGGGFLSLVVALTLLWVVGREPALMSRGAPEGVSTLPSSDRLHGLAQHYFSEPILSVFLVSLILLVAVLGVAVLTRARKVIVSTESGDGTVNP
jgi:NADH:ubiquinone oxidoreductase subunit 6 (subunit J)